MDQYTFNQTMTTMHCGKCGIAFAMTMEKYDRCHDYGEDWYCTNGHCRIFTENENTKLTNQLWAAQQETQRAQNRAIQAESLTVRTSKQYYRIRDRVMAGVCPCCNRTFENLARHMQSKHPEFSPGQRLKAMRDAFGLIQAVLAEEMGVDASHISQFENNKSVTDWAKVNIEHWITTTLAQSDE